MAIDMFMEMTNDLKGETKDSTFKDKGPAIDVLAWSFGMSQSGTFHTAGGGGSGKASVQDLSFTKYVDSSSCDLMTFCCTGEHIDECKLTV